MALGTQLFYSNNDTPETWTQETAKIKIKIIDSAVGKPRSMEVLIVNTFSGGVHAKEAVYTSYRRVKVVEYNTSKTIFVGRVETSQPTQDASYGQILIVTAKDYLQYFIDRKINTDYGTLAVPMKRSAIISQIITDYNVPNNYITKNITTSPSTDTIFRQYASSNKTVARAIEELAQEEPWSDRTWSKVWINGVSRTDINTVSYQFLTAGSQYAYWGQTAPFVGVNVTNVSVVGSYGSFTWQYYASDATWKSLTILQTTTFNGVSMERWEVPSDWAQVSVLGTTAYYVRCLSSTVSSVSTLKAECAVGVGFNYYIDEDGVFQYFRKGSKPVGGPVAAGLTISLNATEGNQQRQMLANYEFTSQPKEIITRVYVKGTAADTGNIVSASACNSALETQLNTIKEKWDFISGSGMNTAELTTYAQNRANSLLYASSSTVNRGAVSVVRYPYYTIGGVTSLLRAGDLIHATCAITGVNTDYEVVDIEYTEPNVSARLNLISPSAGRGQEADDMSNIINRLKDGDDSVIPSARIGDLIAKHITANEILAGDIVVDIGLGTGGTIHSANYNPGVSGWIIDNDGSAEFQDVIVRGTIQAGQYLNVSGGGILAGASAIVLNSSGIGIIGDGTNSASTARIRFANTSAGLYSNNSYIYQANGWLFLGTDSPTSGDSVSIGSLAGDVLISAPARDIDCSNAYVLNLPVKSATATGKDDGSLFYNSTTKEFMGKSNGSWVTLGALSTPAHALDSASHTVSTSLTSSLTATSARTGLMRALSNVSGEYFNGTGGWSVPSGAGGGAYLPLSGGAMTGVIGAVANLSIEATGAAAVLSLVSTGASSPIGIYCNANMVVQSNAGIVYLNAPVGGMRMPVIARASEPAGSYEGQMYYDGTNHLIRHYNGSIWGDIGSGGHTQNTDWILLNSAGGSQLFSSGYLVNTLNANHNTGINGVGSFQFAATGATATIGSGNFMLKAGSIFTINTVDYAAGGNINLYPRLNLNVNTTGWAWFDCSKGIKLPVAASNPSSVQGSLYYNSGDNTIRYTYDGTNWVALATGTISGSYLPLAGGTMSGNLNFNTGLTIYGGGILTLQAVTSLTLTSPTITLTGLVSGGLLSNHAWVSAGDIIIGTGTDTATVFSAVGIPNGYVLTRQSAYVNGVQWQAAAAMSSHALDGSTYHSTPTDITTYNATTTYHGLLPKLSGVSTQFLSGLGTWLTPAGGGSFAMASADVKASRTLGVARTNTSGKWIQCIVTCTGSAGVGIQAVVGGVIMCTCTNMADGSYAFGNISFYVPNGASYVVNTSLFGQGIASWIEYTFG
jgi:hypothetical protein